MILIIFSATISTLLTLAPPAPYPTVTIESISKEIGLVQNYFLAKLHANGDAPLIEDEDLPQKQRFPKPRLPPTGKISSPRKKPLREPGPGKGHPKKKMLFKEGEGWVRDLDAEKKDAKGNGKDATSGTGKGAVKSKLGSVSVAGSMGMEREGSRDADGDADDGDEEPAVGDKMVGIEKGKEIAKGKKLNGVDATANSNDGGMISPESLEAS